MKYTILKHSPARLLLGGFLLLIMAGAMLLFLPIATTNSISLIDAIFTSTSAVCVTGLIVCDTATDFTLFGQIVILILIQLGGLGYMSIGALAVYATGRKIMFSNRIAIKESLNLSNLEGFKSFLRNMFLFVVMMELIGTLLLSYRFTANHNILKGIYLGFFHSISALNNAGFSLFSENFMPYTADGLVNAVVMLLVVSGGLGFGAIQDMGQRIRGSSRRLSLHAQLVLALTIALIGSGAVLVYAFENKHTFRKHNFSLRESAQASMFASVTARTAGFNTIDYAEAQPATRYLTTVLMFIGASPGGTGGGIKTTTAAVVLLACFTALRGRKDTALGARRIPDDLIQKAFVVFSLAVGYVILTLLLILFLEEASLGNTLFEVVSAFGTVGLSTGNGQGLSLCATFLPLSKAIIVITMLVGRLGPMTLFMALLVQKEERVRYPDERIVVG